MHIGQRVKVEMELEITSINDDNGSRSFVCGNVHIGEHERIDGKKKVAYVSGVPMDCVK